MSWLISILVALLNAVVAAIGAGFVASLCVDWYRIPSREGQSGYFIVFMGLLGIAGGFVVGLIVTRIVAAGASPGALKGLGATLAATIALLGAIAGIARMLADIPPTIEGKGLVVEFEVRFPAGFEPPRGANAGDGWSVFITADHGSQRQRSGEMRVKDAAQIDGRWIIPATVDLDTSDSGKSLGVSVPERETQYYNFPLPGKPTGRDMQWSAWLPGPTFGDLAKIPKEEFLAVRYRVQFYVPPPAPPTEEEIHAQENAAEQKTFAALAPDAPIVDWLRFTKYGAPDERVAAVFAAIAARPDFIDGYAALIRSDDREAADLALRGLAKMKSPAPELGTAVIDVGRQIADEIRAVNATTTEEDPGYNRAAALSVRFTGWSLAAFAMHGRGGVDLLPLMREIQDLAKVREESYVMKNDVLRVAKYYVDAWSPRAPDKSAPNP